MSFLAEARFAFCDSIIGINVIVAEEKKTKFKCNNSSLFIASENETISVDIEIFHESRTAAI